LPAPPPRVGRSGRCSLQFLDRLRESLVATRSLLGERLQEQNGELSPEVLEEALVAADVGVTVAGELTSELVDVRRRGRIAAGGEVAWLRERIRSLLDVTAPAPPAVRPRVVLVVGVNGTGKTTTVAKLAAASQHRGGKVMLVAGDTFRAAAVEQLQEWGGRLGVAVAAQRAGADPAAVVFDALQGARARGFDDVFVDTAGRLHTKHNLMAELEKVRRVCARVVDGAPHESLLVLDASTGSNGVAQAREFLAHAEISGVVLSKLDGTAKGGVALAVVRELGVPVRWLGVGESPDDLIPFDAASFAAALLEGVA
jgi:fused signal recognition particle receptor